jgi:hypothetical protein
LKVAIETLHDAPNCEHELRWAQAAMGRISQSSVRIMKHFPVSMTDHAYLSVRNANWRSGAKVLKDRSRVSDLLEALRTPISLFLNEASQAN